MKADQYRKIAEHPLRQVFRNMVQDSRDLPTRTQVREAIDEAVPAGTDQKTKEALFDKAIELAQEAAKDRGSWWDLRGQADLYVLAVVEGWEAEDRILPVEQEEEEEIDMGALAVEIRAQAKLWGE